MTYYHRIFFSVSSSATNICAKTCYWEFYHSNISRVKLRGVVIDKTLKFEIHTNKVCTKVSQSIGVIKRVSNMMPENVLHSLYCALIYLRIAYTVGAWGSAYSSALKRLKSLVKKTISVQNNSANRPDRLFLQYDEVNNYFILCKMFKFICNGEHSHFVNKMD